MEHIAILDQHVIDKIAAGEVIERPSSVVKELVENAIDAGATAITIEIKEGGISFIRITDNGKGIPAKEVPLAFLRHATSKISSDEDLFQISSLGFRGEALSSIAAVSCVELISKTTNALMGIRYVIEGGKERSVEEIGAPNGTTFIMRNLFFNTPVRRKFLKSPNTEAASINELILRLSLSRPNISFKFISNNQIKLNTQGNGNLKELIYQIYGREVAKEIIPFSMAKEGILVEGFLGRPEIARGNRNYENYFMNGRYMKSPLIFKGIEEGYKGFLMQHRYPFVVLNFHVNSEEVDVNVHPTKMEMRIQKQDLLFELLRGGIRETLTEKTSIPEVKLEKPPEIKVSMPKHTPEPFETNRVQQSLREEPPTFEKIERLTPIKEVNPKPEIRPQVFKNIENKLEVPVIEAVIEPVPETLPEVPPVKEMETTESFHSTQQISSVQQMELFEEKLLDKKNKEEIHVIGQVFKTYWLVEFQQKLFIIDQHAAHEKIIFERMMKDMKSRSFHTQYLSPPTIITLSMEEELVINTYEKYFLSTGFVIESFGGREYAISGVPSELLGRDEIDFFHEILDTLTDGSGSHSLIKEELFMEKVAMAACKAAVKGNQNLSLLEAQRMIEELMEAENPYNCPHGRPTIISMTKYELERKFKRIV